MRRCRALVDADRPRTSLTDGEPDLVQQRTLDAGAPDNVTALIVEAYR